MTLAVVTAVYGDHPPPPALPPQSVRVDEQIVVSDRQRKAPGWRTIIEPRSHLVPRMAAKVPKCRPDWYTNADTVVWLDAQVQVKGNALLAWFVDAVEQEQVALIRHPKRSTLLAEAEAGMGREGRHRFDGQSSLTQARSYLRRGHPDGWGLWCGGLVARKMTPATVELGRRWLEEITRWSSHDQVALPFVLRETVGYPAALDWPGLDNGMFRLVNPRRPKG